MSAFDPKRTFGIVALFAAFSRDEGLVFDTVNELLQEDPP
jgi:hypothetical protein